VPCESSLAGWTVGIVVWYEQTMVGDGESEWVDQGYVAERVTNANPACSELRRTRVNRLGNQNAKPASCFG
jgi:hypothetical protein